MMKFLRAGKRVLKDRLYFLVAGYFAFFARIYLRRWNPTVITVTGSSGKTTTLHLLEAQLGDKARYSHKANSSFGIPFDILGLHRSSYRFYEWLIFAVRAPLQTLRPMHSETIYVTEADAERPGEGKFLAQLLRPDITVWLSLAEAHGVQYEKTLSPSERALPAEERLQLLQTKMASEFGQFLAVTKTLAIVQAKNEFIATEVEKAVVKTVAISSDDVTLEIITRDRCQFSYKEYEFTTPLIPHAAGLSLAATAEVAKELKFESRTDFSQLELPPSRSSVFTGQKNTTLLDSTYNATISGMEAMLDLFSNYPAEEEKWLVLGDMVEQGDTESYEHTLLAPMIAAVEPACVVLVGPRLTEHTKPLLEESGLIVFSCLLPSEAYEYLDRELRGGETILFKGARYLEGVVEKLLADQGDATKLCRRETIWKQKRAKWGV